jgi:N-acetylglucosaminyl-diphospho-decaprenol L-rhamnosyltransferase
VSDSIIRRCEAESSAGEAAVSEQATVPEVAVVVVNYDSGDHLRTCMSYLPAAVSPLRAEFVVVDNASKDGSIDGIEDLAPGMRVIRNAENRGYGRACNQGFRATSAPYVCLLNPDVIAEAGSISALVAGLAARPQAGVLGPRLMNPDGTYYPSCRVVPNLRVALGHAVFGLVSDNNRYSRAYKLLDFDHLEEREVDWVSGAAMLVRRHAFEEVGGFDEGFFMYVEDVDLCSRMNDAGWRAVYYPFAEMIHHVAGSSRRAPYKMIRHHHMSHMRFAVKRADGPFRLLLLPAILLGLFLRMLLAWANLFRQKRAERRGL